MLRLKYVKTEYAVDPIGVETQTPRSLLKGGKYFRGSSEDVFFPIGISFSDRKVKRFPLTAKAESQLTDGGAEKGNDCKRGEKEKGSRCIRLPRIKNAYLRYPHLGQIPFSFRAMPHSGQRSILFSGLNSSEAALTPLVNVSLTMFSLSFRRS